MHDRRILVITGAGVSAESGIPTFRGKDGYWRNRDPAKLATPEAFARDPKLVWEWYRERLPKELQGTRPGAVGALLGASVVIGELPNSFVKRQLEIPPGQRLHSPAGVAISLFDQADFVLTSWLVLRPVYRMSLRETMDVSLTVAAIHMPINVLGYALGARTSAI